MNSEGGGSYAVHPAPRSSKAWKSIISSYELKIMNKLITGAAVAAAMLLPVAAFAGTNVTFLTVDGLANTTANVGESINAQVTYDITSNDDVESLSWELVGSGLPKTCVDIPDQINTGTFHPSFDIDTAGATAGTWDVKISLYGTNDEGTNQLCENPADDTMTFSNRVAITETASNNTGVGAGTGNTGNSAGSHTSQLDALIALLTKLIAGGTVGGSTPPPSADPACAAFTAANVGTQPNVYNDSNVRLQGFLLSQGASIPALKAGAAFGYYGNQTTAALGVWRSQHASCV